MALGRRGNQGETALFPAFDETFKKKQGSQEGAVHMGTAAQIHVERHHSTSKAMLGELANRWAAVHRGLTFRLERDRLIVLVDANNALL